MSDPIRISEFNERPTYVRSRVPERPRVPVQRTRTEPRMLDGMSAPPPKPLQLENQVPASKPTPEPMQRSDQAVAMHESVRSFSDEELSQKVEIDDSVETDKVDRNGTLKIVGATLSIVVVSAAVIGGIVFARANNLTISFKNDSTNNQQVAGAVVSKDNSVDESSPDLNEFKNYEVDPTLPKKIIISKIGVNSRVRQIGLDKDDKLMAPQSIFDTGWFEESSKPGSNGAVVIDGRTSGPTKQGVFYNLSKLKPGDIISIERGDGVIFKYGVSKTQTFTKESIDIKTLSQPVDSGNPGLNLVTVNGAQTSDTSEQIVVYTTQIL